MSEHYGLIGAHRVGKTTLAKAFSVPLYLPYAEVSVSSLIYAAGYNPRDQYDIETRFAIQEHVLIRSCEIYDSKPCSIWDRTPIDFLMYMTADILRDFSPELEARFASFKQKCLEAHDRFFRDSCVIQPGIHIIDSETSAPPSPAYIDHLNLIVVGLANDLHYHVMPKDILDLQQRVDYLTDIFKFPQ